MKPFNRTWLAVWTVVAWILGCAIGATLNAQTRTTSPSTTLLASVTTTGSSEAKTPITALRTFHVYGQTTAGAGATTVVIEVSNQDQPTTDQDWVAACTITLTLSTTRTGDGCVMNAAWNKVRARVSAISGTGAAVSARMGN